MIARALAVSFLAASSLLLTIAKAPAVDSSPMRKLVYSFQRAIDQDVTVKTQPSPQGWQQQADTKLKTSKGGQEYVAAGDQIPQTAADAIEGTDAGSATVSGGTAAGHATASSAGTIEVDVLREQPDHGLVVSIHEHVNSVDATPVTCVVYPNTALTCDSQQKVNPEELALLRFLGEGFVDPSQMDARRHWHIAQSGGGLDEIADYQIVGNAGDALTIDESQTIGSNGKTAVTIQSTVAYDFTRSLPTSIDERVVQNRQAGTQSTARSIHTVLKLVSVTPRS